MMEFYSAQWSLLFSEVTDEPPLTASNQQVMITGVSSPKPTVSRVKRSSWIFG